MSIVRPRRRTAAFVALSSLLFVEGCHAYQRPLPGKGIPSQSRVRLRSAEPFAVLPASADGAGPQRRECRATTVEGHVAKATADSVTFQRLSSVVAANGDATSCRWARTTSVIVPVAGTDVTVNRFSGKHTAIGLVITAVTIVALIAFVVSQMEYSIGDGGDCAFC
jgi:hypothetical protein